MSLLHRHLKLDETHNILICPVHECVVLPNSIKKHFDKHHSKDVTPAERAQLQRDIDDLSKAVTLKTKYTEFEFADPQGQPLHEIPHLGLHRSLTCNICDHVCSKKSAEKAMKEHFRNCHEISASPQSRGPSTISQYVRSSFSQRYFIGVSKEAEGLNLLRYFEVIPNSIINETSSSADGLEPSDTNSLDGDISPDNVDGRLPSKLSALSTNNAGTNNVGLKRLQTQLERATKWARLEREERLATVPRGQSMQTNPWLAYTRFLEVLPEKFEDALQYTTAPTPNDEPDLYVLYCTTKSMVRTWQNTTAETSRYARIRVMQEDTSHVPLLPLEAYQYFALKHALPLQKIFVFFYRVLVQGRPAPEQLRLSPSQKENWDRITEHIHSRDGVYPEVETEHSRTHLEPLEQLCHTFWLSLVEQTCLDDEFELTLVLPVAFQVVSSRTKGLREVYNFATDLSALKKMIRLASMQKFRDHFVDPVRGRKQDEADGAVTHPEATSLMGEQMNLPGRWQNEEHRIRSVANSFKAWVYDYLTTEYPTPMNWLINTARYLSRFRYGENLDAFVNWSGDIVSLRGIRTSLSKYTSMVHNEYEHASSLLCKLMFVSQRSQLPTIPWNDLIEDPSNKLPGFSLFSPDSPPLKHHADFIHKQILNPRLHSHEALINDLQNPRQIQNYCVIVQEFCKTLLGLVHFTSGQPARGTELISIHHENPTNGTLRNIFLYNGLVAIVPQYHKGYNRDKSLKVIYRFLPRSIGSLLVWYLWLIRPFYNLIQHMAPEGIQEAHMHRATSSLLWPNQDGTQYATSKILCQVVEEVTEKWMGISINLSTMRHLIIAFGRKIDGTDRVPAELSKEEVDDIVGAAETEEREMQAGHSGVTASTVYALDISNMFAKKFDRAPGQFKVSVKWHDALGFDVEKAFDELYPPPAKAPVDHAIMTGRIQCNYKGLLKENFGKQAVFRAQQENVIRAIMGGETVVAYIAGTGAGKSLAFLLPACYPGYGQTIIIVPLAALRHDIIARCHKHSIRATIWKDGHCDQSASIILATPECIGQAGFIEMTHRLSSNGKLERIVVDEFHYVLLPDHTYRPHLLELRKLTQFGVRLTLLSATIPFQQQVDAFRLLGVPTDTVPFRTSTSRPNLAWQVQNISLCPATLVSDMADYVKKQLVLYPKILVYVDTTTTAEQLSEELQCGKYHGKMTLEERQRSQESFSVALAGILIATAAYLVGIHVPNIRGVLRLGLPDNLINHVQGGGRGGRDDEPCVVRLVLSPQIPNIHYDKADPAAKAMVDAFVQAKVRRPVCRRRVLGEYFDNDIERLTCRAHEQPCDICEERMQPGDPNGPYGAATPTPKHDDYANSARQQPVYTPVRRSTTAYPQPFATPTTASSYPASSPNYELSISRSFQNGTSTTDAIDLVGSPSVPRRLVYSPRKKRPSPSTETGPRKMPPVNKEANSEPSSLPVSSDQRRTAHSLESSPMRSDMSLPDSSMNTFRIARQSRQLQFNAEALGDRNAARSDLFQQQLPATQAFWVKNCAVCFCDRQHYHHPRDQCAKHINYVVSRYRQKMSNTWGRGMCWACLMPVNCCPKWSPSGTGRALQQPDSQAQCVDKRAILDTWAYFWDQCPGVKARWMEKIHGIPGEFDMDNNMDFKRYFQEVVPFGDDYKANRLCLDVNWLTQTFFLNGHSPQELLSDQPSRG